MQAHKFELIGQLAAGVAHEINTPIQYVGSNANFLQRMFTELEPLLAKYDQLLAAAKAGQVPPELVQDVAAARDAADLDYLRREAPVAIQQSLEGVNRVARIVRSMREFSHPGGAKAPIDLNKAVESAVTIAQNEWKYVARMVTEFDPALPPVPCFRDGIHQAILNIIVNAAQAIGEVVGDGSARKGVITVQTRRVGDWAEIRITDTGPGIPPEARPKIFQPFFTTKRVGRGTGQGLAIAHSVVVVQHGGKLTFETATARGTTFIIQLPISHATAGALRRR